MDEQEFISRDYQNVLAVQAFNDNKILFLPTGSGKTFIAIMVLKKLFHLLEPDYAIGGKRAVFLVNTVALVDQQAEVLKRHLLVDEVGRYSGDMNLDFWDRGKWQKEFSKFQVMVMTAEILNQLLLKSYITLNNLAVLILDECHHAVEDHPMRQIMKLFEVCPRDQQPRVIGLTATLLNKNPKSLCRVENDVKTLEVTLHSTIATVNSWEIVKQFSTKPNETFLYFSESDTELWDYIHNAVSKICDLCKNFDFVTDHSMKTKVIPGFIPLKGGKKNDISNLVLQVTKQLGWLGLYGCSKTLIAVLTSLRLLQQKMVDKNSHLMINTLNCHLFALSHVIESKMKAESECQRIMKYSNNKVKAMLLLLKDHFEKCNSAPIDERETLQALIFVDEKMTAKILCCVLKNAARFEEFSFLKPGFMVGGTYNPLSETWEGLYSKQRNDAIVQRFRNGALNILVCTDVLEEGVDIPLCNTVVRFDEVKTFRSYIQSKGRARHKKSLFSLMVPRQRKQSYKEKICYFIEIEKTLERLLVGYTDGRMSPSEHDLDELYLADVPPYVTRMGSRVTLTSAIQLVNGYCLFLAHDRFSRISPQWHMKKHGDGKIQVAVELPKLSSFTKEIKGEKMPNLKIAKRAAALEACIQMHQTGVLDDFLMPNEKCLDTEDMAELLPLWECDDDDKSTHKSGTKQRVRNYSMRTPLCFQGCHPYAERLVYLHEIEMYPIYEKPPVSDNRKYVTFSVLAEKRNFVIVSSEPLNAVCQFPVFSKFGAINVRVTNSMEPIRISEENYMEITCFHYNLFTSTIPVAKNLLIFSRDSILIAPSTLDAQGSATLDWAAMKSFSVEVSKPSLHCIVTPVHRGVSILSEVYFVTRECKDLNAASRFPNPSYMSYADYFNRRHKFKINHPDHPLLEVQPLKVFSNDLLPRVKVVKTSEVDDAIHLPIEVCKVLSNDGCHFLKACLLPSILHRLERLLVADELCSIINSGIKLQKATLVEACKRWQDAVPPAKKIGEKIGTTIPTLTLPILSDVTEILSLSRKKKAISKPWKDSEEPIDIEENFETVSISDIDKYGKFINTKASSQFQCNFQKDLSQSWILPPLQKGEGAIKLVGIQTSGNCGPHPCQIFEATCAASADDLWNLERLETLGDAFLKFAVSIFLFHRFPKFLEGKLTQIKGQILGNRNLFYCAKAKGLADFLKVQKVVPFDNWVPPSFSLPECLLKFPLVLLRQYLQLSDEEQFDGIVKSKTMDDIMEKQSCLSGSLLSNDAKPVYKSYLNMQQQIPDKTVADGVEALIGAYLKTCGPTKATQFLEWMQVLPQGATTLSQNTPCFNNVIDYRSSFYGCEDLEKRLGYTFKNKSLLLEAITHSSSPSATSTYERLEFIGDAVIDFLITAYMYENFGGLTPGQMTDLRSALVNNITFACICVRQGFYKFLNAGSPALLEAIDKFVRFQEGRKHMIDEEVLVLLEERECKIAETVDVPKALGDVFEALIGGVYLDSSKSFVKVWEVLYRLIKNEIRAFHQNPPLQVVRRLHETFGSNNIHFRVSDVAKEVSMDQVLVVLTVEYNNLKKSYNGFGLNKAQAKKSAAKLALRDAFYKS